MADQTPSRSWNELKAELGGLAVFKGVGWLLQQVMGAALEKHKDTVATHLGSIFVSMPYLVVSLFELFQGQLVEDKKLPDHTRYQRRLCEMQRELSNAYRIEIIQGVIDGLKLGKENPTLDDIAKGCKSVIVYHSALDDIEWKEKLHYMDLDKTIVSSDLPKKNEALVVDIHRLTRQKTTANWILGASCVAALLILLLATAC